MQLLHFDRHMMSNGASCLASAGAQVQIDGDNGGALRMGLNARQIDD